MIERIRLATETAFDQIFFPYAEAHMVAIDRNKYNEKANSKVLDRVCSHMCHWPSVGQN